MELIETLIDGLLILKPRVFHDERGYFFESYNQQIFTSLGIKERFVQDNQSFSKKGVVRGLHFQNPPHAQAKLVRVIRGSVLDVAVDLRKNSKTYGKYHAVELSGDNNLQFFIPVGFAHGFVALEDDTVFAYKCSRLYNKESEGSIRFDDPVLDIDWKIEQLIVNEKDLQATSFSDFKSMF